MLMMVCKLFLFSLLLLPSQAMALKSEQKDSAVTQEIEQKDKDNDVFEKEEYQAIYNNCLEKHPEDETQVNQCIREMLAKLDPNELNALINNHQSPNQGKYSPNIYNYGNYKIESSHLTKLQNYLEKRLQEYLYGITKENKFGTTIVGQEIFFKIYKSQLGKNIISSLTSYCLDADENGIAFEDKIEENNKKNFENLRSFKGTRNLAYLHFNNCMGSIRTICHKPKSYEQLLKKSDDPKKEELKESAKYPIERACLVLNELKKMRNTIVAVDKVIKDFDEKTSKDNQGFLFNEIFKNKKIYVGNSSDKKTIDDLTSITSNEIIYGNSKKDNVDLSLDEDEERLKEICGALIEDECLKIIRNQQSDEKKQEELVKEFNARTNLISTQIDQFEPEDIETYLINQGRTEEQVNEILAHINKQGGEAERIKKEIKEQFIAERNAIILQLKRKISKRKLKEGPEMKETGNKIEDIQKELEKRKNEYKQIIHYNNVVAGYLEFRDDEGNVIGRNTRSLFREINDSAYEKSRTPSSEDSIHIRLLKKSIEDQGIEETNMEDENATHSTFRIEQLNLILEGDTLQNSP